MPFGRPKAARLADYPIRPVMAERAEEASVGKWAWMNKAKFNAEVSAEAAKGPDFAGRFAVVSWSCGTSCANSLIVDVRTRKTFEMPFLGVVGCHAVFGERQSIERHADSSLMLVRGSLEITYGSTWGEGPCGTFYYLWSEDHFHLIGCDVPAMLPRHQ